MWAVGLVNALLLAALLTLSHGLLKWVSSHQSESFMQSLMNYWWAVGLALALYAFIFFYYIYVLRSVPIGYLYPVYTGLSIVFVFAMGVFLFDETVSISQLVGGTLILSGVALVTGATR
jgi:small multidrug resistance pump